jgi:multiple sugar transport system substrate-binding protein
MMISLWSPMPGNENDGTAALKASSLALTVCFIMLFLFVPGCTEKKTAGKITIHFVTWKPNQPEVWGEMYRIFEKENPGIAVIRETGPHSSTAFHDLLTQKLKNRSKDVDVFFMDVIWPSEFAAAGWAMPLDEYFPESEGKEFLGGTILANTYEGKIYGVPLFVDSGVLYYRKDLLEKYKFEPPLTWDELVLQAKKIVSEEAKEGSDITGYSGQFKQYEGLVCDMMEFILSNGGYIIDPETGKSALDRKPAMEAVKFVRDRIIRNIAPPGVLTYQEPESLDVFVQGRAIFHRNWPYAWEISNNPAKSAMAGKVGIAKLPHFRGGKSYSALGGWQLGISSYSDNKDAAWRFVKFLTSERIRKLFAVRSGKAPTRTVLYGDPDILGANPHFESMKDVFLTAYPRPRSPLYPAISNILQRFFSTAISNPQSDIAKEAEDASQEIDRLIALTKGKT